jgi:hypothetical protein
MALVDPLMECASHKSQLADINFEAIPTPKEASEGKATHCNAHFLLTVSTKYFVMRIE